MHVTAYKSPLIHAGDDLNAMIAASIPSLSERSIVVIASKAFSTCENRFVTKTTENRDEKHDLVKQEAEWYTDPHSSKYDLMLTMKRNWIFVNAGIDESNADNHYILWPEDPQKSVNTVWQFLRDHYHVKEVGVTMSDSSSLPLNWGVVVHAIAYCGFSPLKSYIGKLDLFGRPMKMEQVNVMQSVTSAAGFEMGEGDESTPFGVVTELPTVQFQDHEPTQQELADLRIEKEDDAWAPILSQAEWHKGNAA